MWPRTLAPERYLNLAANHAPAKGMRALGGQKAVNLWS